MTPQLRAQRLMDLYRMRAQITAQIANIEATIENEARAIRRARDAAQAAGVRVPRGRQALCGTESGYYHHRRQRKEPACDACKLAHAAAEKRRKAAKAS